MFTRHHAYNPLVKRNYIILSTIRNIVDAMCMQEHAWGRKLKPPLKKADVVGNVVGKVDMAQLNRGVHQTFQVGRGVS